MKHIIRSVRRVDASQKLKTRNDITLCSPTLAQNKLEMYSNELKVHRDKTSREKLAHQNNLKEKGIICKFDHELMFPSNLEELGQQYFDKEKVESDDLARYLFREPCAHARTTRLSCKKGKCF